MTLSWTASADNGGRAITKHQYREKVGTGSFGGWQNIPNSAAGEANATSYTRTNRTNGTAYAYEVRAVNEVGDGGESNEAGATPTPAGTVASAPTNLTAMAGNGQVTLSWTASASNGGNAITEHEYCQKESETASCGANDWTDIADSAPGEANATGYGVTSLTNGRAYTFRVRAVNVKGGSEPSNAVAADAEDRDAMAALGSWLAQAGPHGRGTPGLEADVGSAAVSRALTGRDFITGTSFALTGGSAEAGGFAALWGRGSIARFDGREGDLTLDGEVTTGLIGADWASSRWTAGLAIGHSRGAGGYRGDGSGEVEATLTGVYPYGGVTLSDRVSAWAAAGYGSGDVTVTPDGQTPMTADLTMSMGAAGMRSEVLKPETGDGLALAVKGDARFTRTSSGSDRGTSGNLAASDADVWLLRTGVEGTRRFALGEDGASFTPRFEVGLRLDGGDAETGFGADIGGGLAFAAPKRGLALDLEARGLLAHAASGFREWGASAGLSFDPRPRTDRCLSLSLRQGWGASPTGGMDAPLGRETLAGLAANDNGGNRFEASSRLEAEIGYGIAMFGGVFTGTPHAGFGLTQTGRDYRLGWRLTSAVPGDPGFEVGLQATRGENDNAPPEHGVQLRATIRW